MNKKVIGLLAVAGALALSLVAARFDRSNTDRYHQHMEEPAFTPASEEAAAEFSTHLPIVSLKTGGQKIPGEVKDGTTISARLEVRDGGQGCNSLRDEPGLVSDIQLRYRGNSSLWFDKKPYRIKLLEADGESNAQEMLGMPKEDEWILNGPFLDKSLLRSYMLMNISGEVMSTAPEVRYCELFLDGTYQGVYVMMESVSRSQASLGKSVDGRAETSYLVRLDRGGDVNLNTLGMYGMLMDSVVNVVYPTQYNCTPEQMEYITRDISQFEKALYSFDYDDSKEGYRNYINVDSFVDYMVLNEFFQNYDAMSYSTYFYRPVGGKISMGPVWDFNNALDNYIESSFDATGFVFPEDAWYTMLCKDERFVQQVIDRYRQLRRTVLSEEYLQSYVDDTVAWLGTAVDRNFEVWGYTFQPEFGLLEPMERNIGSYEEAVSQVKDFLTRRGAWLDENIELLYQYCHPSATKKYQH